MSFAMPIRRVLWHSRSDHETVYAWVYEEAIGVLSSLSSGHSVAINRLV